MSNEIVSRPEVSSSSTGRVPKNRYVCRFISAKAGKSGKNLKQIEAGFEIITPDVVTLPDGSQSSVAGRKGKVYLTYDATSKAAGGTFTALDRLGLLTPNKDLDVDEAVAKLKDGSVFANMILDSEERIERMLPKPGQQFGDPILDDNGKPVSSGWQFKYISSDAILSKAPAVDGLPPVPQEAAATAAPY